MRVLVKLTQLELNIMQLKFLRRGLCKSAGSKRQATECKQTRARAHHSLWHLGIDGQDSLHNQQEELFHLFDRLRLWDDIF